MKIDLQYFACLAEFGKDVIRKRMQARFKVVRVRGQKSRCPKSLSEKSQRKAVTAKAFYKEGKLSVIEIYENFGINKITLYGYPQHQRIEVSVFDKNSKRKNLK